MDIDRVRKALEPAPGVYANALANELLEQMLTRPSERDLTCDED